MIHEKNLIGDCRGSTAITVIRVREETVAENGTALLRQEPTHAGESDVLRAPSASSGERPCRSLYVKV